MRQAPKANPTLHALRRQAPGSCEVAGTLSRVRGDRETSNQPVTESMRMTDLEPSRTSRRVFRQYRLRSARGISVPGMP
jgi:hypothetical protein